jgi:hypothetical protein
MNALLLVAALGFSQQMIDLNCIEGLVAIERPKLAGVFSFITEKDTTHAFAILLAGDKKAFKKFVEKGEADFKKAGAVTMWDHQVLLNVINLLASPLPEIEQPGEKLKARAVKLSLAPTAELKDITLKRKLQ